MMKRTAKPRLRLRLSGFTCSVFKPSSSPRVARQVMRRWAGALAIATSLFLPASTLQPAAAQRFTGLQFCTSNDQPRTADIYVAVAYQVRDRVAGIEVEDWVSQGWWKIPRNTSLGCVTVISEELENRYYYYYAQGMGRTWGGNYEFCTNPLRAYRADEADLNCEANGFAQLGFRQVDTLGDRGHTVRLY